jgi:hypothetical protein
MVRVCPAQPKSAQPASAKPEASVKATVDKQQILIGQPVRLLLEATVPEATGATTMTWPSLDSLPHFDWIEKGKLDSVIRPGEKYYRQYLILTSFDSGAWSIPRLPFVAANKQYLTDSLRVDVGYSKLDPGKDYHDIKDILDVPNPNEKFISWIIAAVTFLALALVIWLIRKKRRLRRAGAKEPDPVLPPYEHALRQLEELRRQKLLENGQIKAYYTRLNDILHLFVLQKLGISSLADTNDELIRQLKGKSLTSEQSDGLEEALRMSDSVKFAKYLPGPEDNERNFRVIQSSVELLNTIEK